MIQFFLDNLWRWKCGLPENKIEDKNKPGSVPSIEKIKQLSFEGEFVKLMDNRMVMGFFRYGNRHMTKNNYHYINAVKRRIELYEQTGNTELLVDAANILRMEFEMPQHINAHFSSIDDGEHSHNIK